MHDFRLLSLNVYVMQTSTNRFITAPAFATYIIAC